MNKRLFTTTWILVGAWPGISLQGSEIWQGREAVVLFEREFGIWRGLAHVFVGRGRGATMLEYSTDELRKRIAVRLARRLREDPASLIERLRRFDSDVVRYRRQVDAAVLDSVAGAPCEALSASYSAILGAQIEIALYDQFGMYAEPFFDAEVDRILGERICDADRRLEIFDVLTRPWGLSTLQFEQQRLYEILLKHASCDEGRRLLGAAGRGDLRRLLVEHAGDDVKKLVDEFGWVPVFLQNASWGDDHFLRQLTGLVLTLRDGVAAESGADWRDLAERRLAELLQKPARNEAAARDLAEKLELDGYESAVVEAYRLSMHARNECEYQIGLGSQLLRPIVAEICRRLDIDEDQFHGLYAEEVRGLLEGSLTLDDIPLSRLVVAGNWYRDYRDFERLTVVEAREHYDRCRERPSAAVEVPHARAGIGVSHGVAMGPVCVIRGPDDFGKFRPGDIIVAECTTTDYVSLLRAAAGVITENGGRTCHAAIISRELGIPAIAGYAGATHLFSDGQMIRFNASKGTAETLV